MTLGTIRNRGSDDELILRDELPEFSVYINAQGGWNVEIDGDAVLGDFILQFQNCPTPDDIWSAIQEKRTK